MTGRRHPSAVSEHPTVRVAFRQPGGVTGYLYFTEPEDRVLESAERYLAVVGWAACEITGIETEWSCTG